MEACARLGLLVCAVAREDAALVAECRTRLEALLGPGAARDPEVRGLLERVRGQAEAFADDPTAAWAEGFLNPG